MEQEEAVARIRTGLFAIFIAIALSFPSVASAQRAPSAADIEAYEGLHKAAHENDAQAVKELIARGADPDRRDPHGRTPAHVAAFASHEEIIRMLADAGADMNALENDKYDVVTIAAVANDPDLMSVAIEAGNDPGLTTSIYDGTALIAAAHLGHQEVVRRLIEAGAPLDHINNLNWTALIEAVVLGDGGPDHIATVKALVEAGADISIGDRDGVTALQHAEKRGYGEIAAIIRGAER